MTNSDFTETKVFEMFPGYDVHLKGKVYHVLAHNGKVDFIFSGDYYSKSERRVETHGVLGRRISKLVKARIENDDFDEKPWED